MTVPQSVAEILSQHVTVEVEGIDRMYLNAYVPRLQIVEGVLGFIRRHRGHPVASTRMVEPLTRLKQYHKADRALRTETAINNTRDFNIGKRLHNLLRLRQIGFQASRRLLEVEKISHDCILAEEAFQQINRPRRVATQQASPLRFADPKVHAARRASPPAMTGPRPNQPPSNGSAV